MKTILLLITVLFFSQSCTVEEPENNVVNENYANALRESNTLRDSNLAEDFPVAFKNVYFQKWISGVRGGGSGTNFYMEFDELLPEGLVLSQLYFRERTADVERIGKVLYEVRYLDYVNAPIDIPLDKSPIIPPIEINKDEAILEFTLDGRTSLYVIREINQLPTDFYP